MQAGGRNHTTGILGSAFPMDAIVARTRVRDGQEGPTDEGAWGQGHTRALSEQFHQAIAVVWQLAY